MKKLLEIGRPLRLKVTRYDHVSEANATEEFDGEIVGWRESQIVVRVAGYAVLRFWKKNGVEVGNKDHERRGFRIDLAELHGENSGVKVDLGDG